MPALFPEFENENKLRNYPFAESSTLVDTGGNPLDPAFFTDASLYPVNPSGTLYMSRISGEERKVFISDDTGEIMSGEMRGRFVDFHETAYPHRHCGVMLVGPEIDSVALSTANREFTREATLFSPACAFPVRCDGVLSMEIGDGPYCFGIADLRGSSGRVVPSAEVVDGVSTLRLDVHPDASTVKLRTIRKIYVVTEGRTLFRTARYDDNTVWLTLGGVTREDVCAQTHREDLVEGADVCEDPVKPVPVPVPLPEYASELVFDIAASGKNTFNIIVDDAINYNNPLSVRMVDGVQTDNPPVLKNMADPKTRDAEALKIVKQVKQGNGLVLEVPGLR